VRRIVTWSGLSIVALLLVVAVGPEAWPPSTARAATGTFSNPAAITLTDAVGMVPGASVPYPSEIVVSGDTGSVVNVMVT
jgi:hypothetical protein